MAPIPTTNTPQQQQQQTPQAVQASSTGPVVSGIRNGVLAFKSTLSNPNDVTHKLYVREKRDELLRATAGNPDRLMQLLRLQQQQAAPTDETGGVLTREILSQLASPMMPGAAKNILGSSSGTGLTDGSPLIRQDLAPIVSALYVTRFPLYELIRKVMSNGLQYAYDVTTAPDPNTSATANTVSTAINELGAVSFTAGTWVRKFSPITLFGLGRGVSFLELAAVQAGGMPWDPGKMELAGAVVKIAYDVQTLLCSGNGTYAAGTANNEGGLYSASPQYFDGMRQILGSVSGSNYAGNSAVQLEQGTLNMTQTIKAAAAKAAQQGGMPDVCVLTINGKEQLDQENEQNKRYNDNLAEIVPGVQVNQLTYANGTIKVIGIPGFSFGTYTSPLSTLTVEDAYILQMDQIEIPYLYDEGITVLELPAAVDYTLSQRYILFAMYGLAVKAPPFMAKARRLAA